MKNETAAHFHRPAEHDPDLVVGIGHLDLQLLQEAGKGDAVDFAVDDQAHGAVGGMGAQIDHRLGEPGIGHLRHGDEKLTGQVAILGR